MKNRFSARVFAIAGIYGIIVLAPQYFMESRIGRDYPPPITHPEHFYGFIGTALAWQFLFFVIAKDPVRYRMAMIPAVLEKLAFGVPAVVLYLQGRLAGTVACFGVADLVLAASFAFAYRATAPSQERAVA